MVALPTLFWLQLDPRKMCAMSQNPAVVTGWQGRTLVIAPCRSEEKYRRNRKLIRNLLSMSRAVFSSADGTKGTAEFDQLVDAFRMNRMKLSHYCPRVVETCWTTLNHAGSGELHIKMYEYVGHEKPDQIE